AIDPIEAHIAAAFPERRAYTAWLSGRVIEKVRAERGEMHDTLEQALDRIESDGVDDLVVQPTCLMQGFEMRRVRETLCRWAKPDVSVRLGSPLLDTQDDRKALAAILSGEYSCIAQSDVLLFMGHGSATGGNDVFTQIETEFANLGHEHFMVATVEGTPTFEDVLARIEGRAPACVHLVPLMIVAGEHATVDMAGGGPDSWANQLTARGFEVDCIIRGLGEYPAVRELIAEHARNARPLEGETRS
ncbi:MAG: sirohydrochlorin cobaltochelatase, partial [Eggerthellaceae bacterium]|nr:sirohydrochlorin cobaltochelatase [Eggerthellaceae bacterium]